MLQKKKKIIKYICTIFLEALIGNHAIWCSWKKIFKAKGEVEYILKYLLEKTYMCPVFSREVLCLGLRN